MLKERYRDQMFGGYKLLNQLTEGPGGQIYLAQSTSIAGRMAVVKLLSGKSLLSLTSEKQFREKYRDLLTLKDEHILPLIDAGIERRQPYLIMEYVTGGSLRQRLKLRAPAAFGSDEAITIITEIGLALDHAHQRDIVHGNLKPENILFDADERALLSDFTIPAFVDNITQLPLSSKLSHYLAPEQVIQGVRTREADQYALASIAYELLTGRTPFAESDPLLRLVLLTREPTAPRRINAALSINVEKALLKALAKDPHERYETTAAFIAALQGGSRLTIPSVQDQNPEPAQDDASETDTPMEVLAEPTALISSSDASTEPAALVPSTPSAVAAHARYSSLINDGLDTDKARVRVLGVPLFKDNAGAARRRLPIAVLLVLLLIFGSTFLLFKNSQPHRAQVTIENGTPLAVQEEQITRAPTSPSITPVPSRTSSVVAQLIPSPTPAPYTSPTPTVLSRPVHSVSTSSVAHAGTKASSSGATVNTPVPVTSRVPTPAPAAAAVAPASVTAPSLVGSLASAPQSVNLSSEGSLDWAVWGYQKSLTLNHKSGGGSQISASSRIGNTDTPVSCSNPVIFAWNDGSPISAVGSETCNEWTYTQGNGFQFTVQGGRQTRTLRVYVGIGSAQGLFTASCSDGKGGTLEFRDTSLTNYSGQMNGVYVISYRTPSPDQALTITFTISNVQNNAGAIDLEAATLQ